MKLMTAISTAVILITALSATAQDAVQKEVAAVDAARIEALKAGDGEAWGKTIADDCAWVDMSTGELVQNKAQRIKGISESGGIDARTPTDVQWHVLDNRVIQTGQGGNGRFIRVYVKNGNAWQMVALNVERFPEN